MNELSGSEADTMSTSAPLSKVGDESPSEHKHWYQKGAFIVPATLAVTLLLVGAVFHFWVMRRRNRKTRGVGGSPGVGRRVYNDDVEYNYGLDGQDCDSETDSLLRGKDYGTTMSSISKDSRFINTPFSDDFDKGRSPLKLNNNNGFINQGPQFSPVSPPIREATPTEDRNEKSSGDDSKSSSSKNAALANAKFLNYAIAEGSIDQSGVLRNFEDILRVGLVISLHTLKGPKPVLFSMLNGEVRWQAVKLAQKRYKLSLKDITSVEEGKITENFARSASGEDSHCFSLLTSKTTLDLEASCAVDRDCLVFGFRHYIAKENNRVSSPNTEDAFL